MPQDFLKNIIIGVGVSGQTKRDLESLSKRCKADFYDIQNDEIENIFQKISLGLGLLTRTALIGV